MDSVKIDVKKTARRFVSILLAAVIAVSVVPARADAISNKRLMETYHQWMADHGGTSWDICLMDFDENGVMEGIAVEYGYGLVIVLTYSKTTKKVKELVETPFDGLHVYVGLRQGGFYIKGKSGGKMITRFYRMKSGKVKVIKQAVAGKTKSGKTYYKVNGKRVRKATYKKQFKGYINRGYKIVIN